MRIYPAILSDNLEKIQLQLDLVKKYDWLDVVQIDIIDGLFADNMTVAVEDLTGLDFGELQIDLHLMVLEPLSVVNDFLSFKDELPVRAVIGQLERMSHPQEFINELKKEELKAGLGLDLFTAVEEIQPYLNQDLDMVQLMGVEAGWQGRQFNKLLYKNVHQLQSLLEKLLEKAAAEKSFDPRDIDILVDGGVKFPQLEELQQLNVDGVGIGSLIFAAEERGEKVEEIMSQLKKFSK